MSRLVLPLALAAIAAGLCREAAAQEPLECAEPPLAPVLKPVKVLDHGGGSFDVELDWENREAYEQITVRRNGVPLMTWVKAESPSQSAPIFYQDRVGATLPDGLYLYEVAVLTVPRRCREERKAETEVRIFRIPDGGLVLLPLAAHLDLGLEDLESGLERIESIETVFGETEVSRCGPEADLRDARSAVLEGATTPPAHYLHLADTAREVRPLEQVLVAAVVYDAPELAGRTIGLEYTAKGATDFADPKAYQRASADAGLSGSGQWKTIYWEIADAGFRGLQRGGADFRLAILGEFPLCVDQVLLFDASDDATRFPVFRRGDADGNGRADMSDAIFKLKYLFLASSLTREPSCLDAMDVDDDGRLGVSGAIYLLFWLFNGGEPPKAPGPLAGACGRDPTSDNFRVCNYGACD